MWLLGLVACGRPIVSSTMVQPAVYVYTEHQAFGSLPERQVIVTETYAPVEGVALPEGLEGAVYESIRSENGRESGPRTRFVVGPEGVARFALLRSGTWISEGVKVELPGRVRVGDAWTGDYSDAANPHQRDCVAESTPFCEGGIATRCTTSWTARTLWLRQHWCPALGWVAFEALARADGQPEAVFYSTGASRNGQVLPAVAIEARPWSAL